MSSIDAVSEADLSPDGGQNLAVPIAVSGATSGAGHSGKVVAVSSANNGVIQLADGGDGSAVGTYGSHNHFYERSKYIDSVIGNNNNGIVIGSGNGGGKSTSIRVRS